MHQFCRADNGVHRAGLNAFGAADAFVFTNDGHPFDVTGAAFFGIQRKHLAAKQLRQGNDGSFTAGRAAIMFFAGSNGFGIGAAARMAALATLGLR